MPDTKPSSNELTPLLATPGDDFAAMCHVPLEVSHITVFSNREVLPRMFFSDFTSLKALELTPLSRVTYILEGFLEGCTALTSINLTPLSGVVEIQKEVFSSMHGSIVARPQPPC